MDGSWWRILKKCAPLEKLKCSVMSNPLQTHGLPVSSVCGNLQARILEWVAISSPGDLPNPGIKPGSPELWADSLPSEPPGKPTMAHYFSIPALRMPWTVWKGKKIGHWKVELPRSVELQYATGDQWRNNSRKNEEMEPKQQQHSIVSVTGDGSKVRCCKEQYCIGTWNIKSMNQGKLEVIKWDGKSEHRHFRNQWTETDWNGWI